MTRCAAPEFARVQALRERGLNASLEARRPTQVGARGSAGARTRGGGAIVIREGTDGPRSVPCALVDPVTATC